MAQAANTCNTRVGCALSSRMQMFTHAVRMYRISDSIRNKSIEPQRHISHIKEVLRALSCLCVFLDFLSQEGSEIGKQMPAQSPPISRCSLTKGKCQNVLRDLHFTVRAIKLFLWAKKALHSTGGIINVFNYHFRFSSCYNTYVFLGGRFARGHYIHADRR